MSCDSNQLTAYSSLTSFGEQAHGLLRKLANAKFAYAHTMPFT